VLKVVLRITACILAFGDDPQAWSFGVTQLQLGWHTVYLHLDVVKGLLLAFAVQLFGLFVLHAGGDVDFHYALLWRWLFMLLFPLGCRIGYFHVLRHCSQNYPLAEQLGDLFRGDSHLLVSFLVLFALIQLRIRL